MRTSGIRGLTVAAASAAGSARRRRRRVEQGHHDQDGGAGLAADPDHAGLANEQLQGAVRQQRQARGRLHPVAGLLRAPRRLAHLRRAEVPDGGVRQPVARRLRRGRLLHEDQRVHRRRPGAAGDLRGPASEPGRGLLDLSAQVRELLRLPADAGRADRLLSQGPVLQRAGAGRVSRRSTARSCPAIRPRWTTSTGTRSRSSASSSAATRATSWPGSRSTTTSTASPIRRARPTTSPSCRSTPSSGSTAPTSGTRPRRRKARRKAWSTRPRRSRRSSTICRCSEYMPPVVKTGTMDIFKTDELFREGKVAWIIQWIGFAESAITPATSKVADKVAFAVASGHARARRQAQPLGQHRRPAVRHDHLERRRDGRARWSTS